MKMRKVTLWLIILIKLEMGLLEVEVTLEHPFIMMMDFILQVILTQTVPQVVALVQAIV